MTYGCFEKLALLGSNGLWGRTKFYYTASDQTEYICSHVSLVATSVDGWHVWKLSYNADGTVDDIQGPLRGTADGRAALGWI